MAGAAATKEKPTVPGVTGQGRAAADVPDEPDAAEPTQDAVSLPPGIEGIMRLMLEQQAAAFEARLAGMASLLERSAQETREREQAAAEAAARKRLPPAHDEAEADFEPVLFRSKGDAFRVIRVGRHQYTAENGEKQTTNGRDYQFVHGSLGLSELRVLNSNVADWLRARPTFNREFWEVGKEPHAPPDPAIVMEKIMAAAIELDDERLGELLELEEASHQRPVILAAIRQARRKIQGKEE